MEDTTTAAQKIFFSYSRTDGQEHALKLASNLRNAGANVWIDQLDIELGKLWDLEVEKALNTSDCVLFIATEKSTTSNNVLNEVYYALDENKKVIPVVFHDCRIPFQLRRLQRIDFTADYNAAFERLMKALGLKEGTASPTGAAVKESIVPSAPKAAKSEELTKLPEEPAVKTKEPFINEEPKPEKPKQGEPAFASTKPETSPPVFEGPEKPKSKKGLLWGIGAVAAAAIVFFGVRGTAGSANDAKKPDGSAMVLSKSAGPAPVDSFSVLTQNTPQTKTGSVTTKEGQGKTAQSGNGNASPSTGTADKDKLFNDHKQSGMHKFADKDFKGAIDDFLKALDIKPDAEVAFHTGRAYGLLEDYTNAAAYYSKAIDADPKNWNYYNSRGNAYRKSANYTAAVSDYDQAISLAPKTGLPYANRGLCKQAVNDAAGACQDFSTAMNLGEETGKTAYNTYCTQKPSINPNPTRPGRITLQPNTNSLKKYQKAASPKTNY